MTHRPHLPATFAPVGVVDQPTRTSKDTGSISFLGCPSTPDLGPAANATHYVTLPTVEGFSAWVNAGELDVLTLAHRMSTTAGARLKADGLPRKGAHHLARLHLVRRTHGVPKHPDVVVRARELSPDREQVIEKVRAALWNPEDVPPYADDAFEAEAGDDLRTTLDAVFRYVTVRA